MMKYRSFILSSFFLLFFVIYSPPTHAKIGELTAPTEMKAEGPVDIEGDELTYDRETQTYEAHGQVEVVRGDLSLKADHARLNMATKELTAWGNVLLREGEDVIECQRLEVNIENRSGKIHQAKLYLKDQNFHVTGREIEKLGENHYRVRDASMTTCDAERPPWKFAVKEIEIKEMAVGGVGIAKGPIFYLEDIPVLYFPWAALPVRQERQTGFLIPQLGYHSDHGPEVRTGFYWAPTKNMDATLYLDYLGNRGFKEGLEFRYAFAQETKGEAHFYYIYDQDVQSDLPVVVPKNRYAFFIEHQQKLPYGFYLKADIEHVSDHQYLDDYDEDIPDRAAIDAWSARQLRSVVFGGKNWDQFSFLLAGMVFDDLTKDSNDRTVQKLPQVSFYAHPQSLFQTPLFWDLTSSYFNFWRERGVEAQRGDLFPRVSYPARLFDFLKFESDVGLRESLYYSYNDPTGRIGGWRSRQILEANVQLSTEFYRVYDAETFPMISNLFKVTKWMHTIEPLVSYTYIPRVNQSRLPVFDDVDQIPFTNQITYGVTQRLLGKGEGSNSGPVEYGKLIISQSYSLEDPSFFNPAFTDSEGKKRSFSNIRGELWWRFKPYLEAHWDAELNPYRGSFDAFDFSIIGRDKRNDAISIQFRDTKGIQPAMGGSRLNTVKEINLLGRVRTIPPLYLFGAYYYNLLERTWVQAFIGAEYQAQCWSAGFAVSARNSSPDGTVKKETKFQFYVTLLNLGSVGHKSPYMNF
ncbi:MAG: LPS-assembly protein LptD [Thermodesulfobacteriota bacterium]